MILEFGEPLILFDSTNEYMVIGDGITVIPNLPRTKIVKEQNNVDANNVLYFYEKNIGTESSPKIVNAVIDDEGTEKNLMTDSSVVMYTGDKFEHQSIQNLLDSGIINTVLIEKDSQNEKVYVVGVPLNSTELAQPNINKSLRYAAVGTGTANEKSIYFNAATGVLFGSAWNDFAEFRNCQEDAGTCVIERGDGTLIKSTDRLMPGASIISDTYGMIIGERNESYAPIAVAGRVLARPNPGEFFRAGQCVCSGPDGTVSVMSREEIKEFPDCIVGTVSEIPEYTSWQDVPINGRIWIKLR